MPDEARRNRIEDAAQREAAARCDHHGRLLIIGAPPLRQLFQGGPFRLDKLAIARIAAASNLVDEAAVGRQIGEVAGAAQKQRILDGLLQMPMDAFDGAVLMGDARIVARWLHAVMRNQRIITARQVLLFVAGKIAKGRGETIGAMILRHAAQRPKRVLQTLGKRHKALAAKDDMSMLEARAGQAEMIEPVIERCARDGDVKGGHIGEIRKPKPARRMRLREDHIPFWAMLRPPFADTPLQGAAYARGDLRVTPVDLFVDGNRAQIRRGLNHRHDLLLPNALERIGAPPPSRCLLLRR